MRLIKSDDCRSPQTLNRKLALAPFEEQQETVCTITSNSTCSFGVPYHVCYEIAQLSSRSLRHACGHITFIREHFAAFASSWSTVSRYMLVSQARFEKKFLDWLGYTKSGASRWTNKNLTDASIRLSRSIVTRHP